MKFDSGVLLKTVAIISSVDNPTPSIVVSLRMCKIFIVVFVVTE